MSPGSGAAERSPAMRRGRRGGKGGEAKAEAAMGSGLDSKSAESVVNGGGEELPPPPPRLLTVPTVLTIGRVAAVPLLVSSRSTFLPNLRKDKGDFDAHSHLV